MAKSDIIRRAKPLLYGPGLGEKPRLVRTASAASISTTGEITTFDLFAGEGSKVRAGDVLASMNVTDETDAFVAYVLGISTDTVTVTFIDGSPVPTGTDLNDQILEVNPLVTEHALALNIDVIIDNWLFPEVVDIVATNSVTPDLTDGQVELSGTARDILSAYQIVNGTSYPVRWKIRRNMNTNVSSTGVLGFFEPYDGSLIYYTTLEEVTVATTDTGLQHMIATGATALSLDGTVVETSLESSKKDSQDRPADSVASNMWRSFLSQKQAISEDQSRDTVQLVIER